MSAAAAQYAERRSVAARVRVLVRSITRMHRTMIGLGVVGLLGTFAGVLASGSADRIQQAAFVPWVLLLAIELGPNWGALAGLAATGFYVVAVEDFGGSQSSLELAVRACSVVAIGLGGGLLSRRISSDAHELQATAALQQALLDSTLDGICLTDLEGNIVLGNVPLGRYGLELGLPLHGTVVERLLSAADRMTEPDRFRQRMLALATDLEPSADEFELADSGRVFRGYTAPVKRGDGSLIGRIWTLREVTADRQLERLRDAFVAAVSHELRTPLTSISGFLEMLEDEEADLGVAGQNYLAVIRRGTVRLQRIVEDLLLVAQIEADRLELRPVQIDLAEVVEAAVDAARPYAAEKDISLELDVSGPLPLEADGQRLEQVLDNLVSNAIKFTSAGGSVHLSATNGGDRAKVEVVDNGIGVPQDEIGQLFSRFYRASTATRRAIPGTGLGLVIARAIVEGHGGSISLESREGEGTKVTVTLPRTYAGGT